MSGINSVGVTIHLEKVTGVRVTDDFITVTLEDDRSITVPTAWYPRLAHGTAGERAEYRIGGGGYGIHWPALDEDIGVEGLLLGKRSTESNESFDRWLKARA